MFKIVRDVSHNLIDVRLSGFFEVADAEEYVAAIKDMFFRARMAAGYRIIIDCSECQLQKQEVLAVFAKHMAEFPKAKRIAVVTGSSLIRMQIKRVMTQSYMEIFEDRQAAHHWVINDAVEKAA